MSEMTGFSHSGANSLEGLSSRPTTLRANSLIAVCIPRQIPKTGNPDSRAVREKSAAQLSEKDRRQAETLAQRFVPTLERPIDDGSARAVVQKPASGR